MEIKKATAVMISVLAQVTLDLHACCFSIVSVIFWLVLFSEVVYLVWLLRRSGSSEQRWDALLWVSLFLTNAGRFKDRSLNSVCHLAFHLTR